MTFILLSIPAAAPTVITYYQGISGSLATWSIAIAAASIALLSFLFMKIRDVYETDEYLEVIKTMRAFSPDTKIHAPLSRFFVLIWSTIVVATIGAAMHLTVGKIEETWASVVCLCVAGLMLAMFACELVAMFLNVRYLIRASGLKGEKKLASR